MTRRLSHRWLVGRVLAAQGPYPTRFVAPDTGGTRFVKGVTQLEALALDPATDPTSFERLSLEQPEYG